MRVFSPSRLVPCCKKIQCLPSGKRAFLTETGAQLKLNKTLGICWVVGSNQSVFLYLSCKLHECSFAKKLQYKSPVSKLTWIFHLPPIRHLSTSKQIAKLLFHLQSRLPNQIERQWSTLNHFYKMHCCAYIFSLAVAHCGLTFTRGTCNC